jgi:hypothetical protein
MKKQIHQIAGVIAICVVVASCNFSSSEKQDRAQDSLAVADTFALAPLDSARADTLKSE